MSRFYPFPWVISNLYTTGFPGFLTEPEKFRVYVLKRDRVTEIYRFPLPYPSPCGEGVRGVGMVEPGNHGYAVDLYNPGNTDYDFLRDKGKPRNRDREEYSRTNRQ